MPSDMIAADPWYRVQGGVGSAKGGQPNIPDLTVTQKQFSAQKPDPTGTQVRRCLS